MPVVEESTPELEVISHLISFRLALSHIGALLTYHTFRYESRPVRVSTLGRPVGWDRTKATAH
jgi:hypothetical protein